MQGVMHSVTKRKLLGAIIAAVVAAALAVGTLGPSSGDASSHREAPLMPAEPQADTTCV